VGGRGRRRRSGRSSAASRCWPGCGAALRRIIKPTRSLSRLDKEVRRIHGACRIVDRHNASTGQRPFSTRFPEVDLLHPANYLAVAVVSSATSKSGQPTYG